MVLIAGYVICNRSLAALHLDSVYLYRSIIGSAVDQFRTLVSLIDIELRGLKALFRKVQVEVQIDKPAEEPSMVIPKANLPYPSALNPNDQDALDSAAGGNFLDKIPRECLSIIGSKSKVRYSRSRVTDVRANANAPLSSSSHSNSFDLQQIAAALEDKLDIRMNRFEKSLNEMKNSFITPTAPLKAVTEIVAALEDKLDIRMNRFEKSLNEIKNSFITPTAPLKAVTEVCVTCGSNHSYNQCPLTRGGNDFLVFHDNIQQFQTAAVGNFIQNRQNVSNQTRPPGFHQSTQQNNNQNCFQSNNLNQNRQPNQGAIYQNRPPQNPNFQATPQQNTVTQGKFEAYTTKQDEFQNQMMQFMQNLYNKPSTSSSSLSSNTIPNPKGEAKAITTRSGMSYKEPPIPPTGVNQQEPVEATTDTEPQNSDDIHPPTVQAEVHVDKPAEEPTVVIPKAKTNLPYPSRLQKGNFERRTTFLQLSLWKSFEIYTSNLVSPMPLYTCRNRSVSKPIGIAKDVSVKVGVFHFPADFVVVEFELDPRVPLILGRYFLNIGQALINVHKGELTLRIRNEAITYNLDQTSRYSTNYDQMTANKIDVTDEACEEYSQEDDPDSQEVNPSYYDPEGDILLLEAILNSKPSPPLPNHEQSMPSFKNELKACEAKTIKSSIDEPPEVQLKDLPPHLEYAFLEGDNKLLVIIAKELGDEEKSALIK
nr:reverse transcriptase domain-containing protein [Tanacetum cinerariifolium]